MIFVSPNLKHRWLAPKPLSSVTARILALTIGDSADISAGTALRLFTAYCLFWPGTRSYRNAGDSPSSAGAYTMAMELQRLSRRLAKLLAEKQRFVVFAESCTAGLVAATLSQVPGISQFLCGSMVVYQDGTKNAWLGIESSVLKRPGSVSELVARRMAEGVLKKTPQAHLAASVTGHLGPNAPANLDGVIFIGIHERSEGRHDVLVSRHQLENSSRMARQREATRLVLMSVIKTLESPGH